MIPLSASLLAHQAGRARLPAITVIASARRGGVDLLRWTRCYTGSEADSPHAAVLTDAGTLIRVRNDGGAVMQSRVPGASPASTFSSWIQITSLAVGGTLAIGACAGELTLVTANGTYLDVRHSSDDGSNLGKLDHSPHEPHADHRLHGRLQRQRHRSLRLLHGHREHRPLPSAARGGRMVARPATISAEAMLRAVLVDTGDYGDAADAVVCAVWA